MFKFSGWVLFNKMSHALFTKRDLEELILYLLQRYNNVSYSFEYKNGAIDFKSFFITDNTIKSVQHHHTNVIKEYKDIHDIIIAPKKAIIISIRVEDTLWTREANTASIIKYDQGVITKSRQIRNTKYNQLAQITTIKLITGNGTCIMKLNDIICWQVGFYNNLKSGIEERWLTDSKNGGIPMIYRYYYKGKEINKSRAFKLYKEYMDVYFCYDIISLIWQLLIKDMM